MGRFSAVLLWAERSRAHWGAFGAPVWGGAEPHPSEKDGECVSVSAMAQEVLDGKWGNGEERKRKLGAWFYDLVQGEVNRMLGV